jgi:hypothetical protein
MKSCEGCKHIKSRRYVNPCLQCLEKYPRQNWEPTQEISELIEASERIAFEAGLVSRGRPRWMTDVAIDSLYRSWKGVSK